jgi:dTDP-4-dehydrorhamnose reductase
MTKILVTGATGLLGCALTPLLRASGEHVMQAGLTGAADFQADLTSYPATAAMLEQARPDVIINLAALTNVDACEITPHSAYLLNVHTVENLCRWIKHQSGNCHLIQISTDQLYDADADAGVGLADHAAASAGHAESEITISNVYAFSKIAAEIAAASVSSTILRTNFFGRSQRAGRDSLTDWLYQALRSQSAIKVFEDVWFSPLSIATLTALLAQLVRLRPQGVFNLGSHGGMSKADFAYAFAAAADLPTASMQRVQSASLTALKAYRPKDMRMDSSHFERQTGILLPQLIDEIYLAGSAYHA